MSNSSHGERVVSASQCHSDRQLVEKYKKKTWLLVLGTSNWCLVIEEERKSKTEKEEEEGKRR